MTQSAHVVVHVTPDGRSLPARDRHGHILVFRDVANATSFARGLLEAGLPEATLTAPEDLDPLGSEPSDNETWVFFEDDLVETTAAERRETARRLAVDLAPLLLRL